MFFHTFDIAIDVILVDMFRKISTIAAVFTVFLLLMALQKPLFLLWYASQAAEASFSELVGVSLHGLLLDLTVAGYLSVIPWLMLLATVFVTIPERSMRRMLNGYFIVISVIVSLLVAGDMGLYRHWGFRIDSTLLPYLKTPKEAAASVTWGDFVPTFLLFVGYVTLMIFALRPTAKLYRAERLSPLHRAGAAVLMLLVGGLLFLAIRGGVGTATANVSKVYFSDKMFLNQAATNPIFSFLSSASRSELRDGDFCYFSEEECAAIVDSMYEKGADATGNAVHLTTQRPNVVLVILESLGRTVTDEVVDGREVTPNLNRLRREGVWFENLYANSFRTDRGTVAIMSGYPTHPKASIMKYPQKAHTLPSIARSLRGVGYATSFTYGGDANFTNTASYLYGTGIEKVIDEKLLSFPDARDTKWGYDDDFVCQYFADEVLRMSAESRPFFATLLTLSSHEPFEVPFDAFGNKILNAAAFTDYHVGMMVEKWRQSPAWDNLLVVMIADHGMPYPKSLTIGEPLRQRIPMIWCGGAVKEPFVCETISSQADLATTLLHQMGIETSDFEFSRDIFDNEIEHFGFYTYNNGFGMISQEGFMRYDCVSNACVDGLGGEEVTELLVRRSKALVQALHKDIIER